MPPWIRETVEYIAQEAGVIRDAPTAFGIFVILAALAIWGALSWKFDAQISSRDSIISARDATIKFQDGLISEYKSRVQLPQSGEDRTLMPEQRRTLTHDFKIKSAKFKRLVIVYIDDPEPCQFAKQFASIANTNDLPVVQRSLGSIFCGGRWTVCSGL